MAAAIDVLRHKVTDHAANQYIGRKVLMGANARNVHQRRETVSHDFGERAWILVRDDSSHGPRRSGVFRRKGRTATLKERAAAIALIRSFTPQRILHSLHHHQTVQRRFASEKTGLAPVLIVEGMKYSLRRERPYQGDGSGSF